jgi:hypothetical protein
METKSQQQKYPVFKKKLVFSDKFEMQRVRVALINAIFEKKLANREIDYLAYYLALSGDIVDLGGRFSATATEIVKKQMGVTSQRMTNIKKGLKKKNLIIEKDGKEEIIPELHPKSQEGAGFIIGLQVSIGSGENQDVSE